MPQLLIAALVLGLVWYGLKFFARASPATVARLVRRGGGAIVGMVGLLLVVRGRPDLGIAAIGAGLWLSGFLRLPGRGMPFRPAARAGAARSKVRAASVEMELDHASGALDGTILRGPLAGRRLSTLTRPECDGFFRLCAGDDPDAARLLEAYMDRRFAGWREAGQAQGDSGRTGRSNRTVSGVSPEQAYEILGLRKGASRDDVVRAHRTLMKKFHPDHGGTTALAARANEAKEVLLRSVQ